MPTEELVEMPGRICVAVAKVIVPINPALAEIQPLPQWRPGVLAFS